MLNKYPYNIHRILFFHLVLFVSGLLKPSLLIFPLARNLIYFLEKYKFSKKYKLAPLNHIHIWQVSPQLSLYSIVNYDFGASEKHEK